MARSSRDRRIANWIKGGAVVLVCLVGVGACVATTLGADNSTAVPAPEATERADTVALLARASATQDVCYGWRLRDGYGDEVNTGSNLGDGVSSIAYPWLASALTRDPIHIAAVAVVTRRSAPISARLGSSAASTTCDQA